VDMLSSYPSTSDPLPMSPAAWGNRGNSVAIAGVTQAR
jgi:hypothetical protein